MSPSGHVPLVPERYAHSRISRAAGSDVWRDTVHDTQEHPTDAVVVGYDGSEAADEAVEWAAVQAVRTGGRLDLVAAWEYPTSWGNVIPLPSDYDPSADARSMLDPVVGRLEAAHPGLAVHAHVIEGHASEVLVEASRHAALLVVASRGHGSFSGIVLGSVSQHCVTHAACPVVVFRRGTDH
jgi:nucleotide-binding universal stress UspA family protein